MISASPKGTSSSASYFGPVCGCRGISATNRQQPEQEPTQVGSNLVVQCQGETHIRWCGLGIPFFEGADSLLENRDRGGNKQETQQKGSVGQREAGVEAAGHLQLGKS
jgi:hypothetical protein